MTARIVDTDTFSLYLYGDANVTRNLQRTPKADLFVSVITVEEVLLGWHTRVSRARSPQDLEDVYNRMATALSALARLQVVGYSVGAQTRYKTLHTSCKNVGGNDLRIAAIALEIGATVVTRNTRDFGRVVGLPLVNWADPSGDEVAGEV